MRRLIAFWVAVLYCVCVNAQRSPSPGPHEPQPVPYEHVFCYDRQPVHPTMFGVDCATLINRLPTDHLPHNSLPIWGYGLPPLVSLSHRLPRTNTHLTCELELFLAKGASPIIRGGPSVAMAKDVLREVWAKCGDMGGVAAWGRLRLGLRYSGRLPRVGGTQITPNASISNETEVVNALTRLGGRNGTEVPVELPADLADATER